MTDLLTLALVVLTLAPAQSPTSSDVAFDSHGVRLTASLTIPAGSGRRPAIVLIGGSGASPAAMLKPFADQLAGLGLVTLAYDKRGSGQSGGDWTSASLEDMTDDAAAAMQFVAARPEVDPARVGVWAVSQGGWVVSRLATRPAPPAFAIVLTGGGASPRDVELASHHLQLDRAGISGDDRAEAEAMLARYFDWLGTGKDRPGLERAIADARGKAWYKVVSLDGVLPSEAGRPSWSWVATYQPVPDIAAMKMPTLILLGELDRQLTAASAAAAWRTGLERAGNPLSEVTIIPGMGHAGLQGEEHKPGLPKSAGYFAAVEKWVSATFRSSRAPSPAS